MELAALAALVVARVAAAAVGLVYVPARAAFAFAPALPEAGVALAPAPEREASLVDLLADAFALPIFSQIQTNRPRVLDPCRKHLFRLRIPTA